MEKDAMSKSAPAIPKLYDEDYVVAGTPDYRERVLLGCMSKDKGTYSSRINQIVRQAEKVPGPGKYVAHKEWDVANGVKDHVIHAGNKFPNGTRDYKPCNTTPAPATYEHKEFMNGTSNATNVGLSIRRRVLHGRIPKGKKRSFLDQAVAHGAAAPAPGTYELKQHRNNRADTSTLKNISWSLEMKKSKGRGPGGTPASPGLVYDPKFDAQMDKQPCYAIPKAKAQNFLDRAVKEKWCDAKTKKEIPGPGTYNVHNRDDSKFSRGGAYLQRRGLSRSSTIGYF